MKTIQLLACIALALGTSAAFTSCELTDDEALQLEDNLNAQGTLSTLGTVVASGEYLAIESDSYGTLVPINPEMIREADADSTGQRIVAGFVFLSNDTQRSVHESQPVRIVDLLYKVMTLRAIDLRQDTEATIGDSPLQIVNATLSKNHLNIQYAYSGANEDTHGFRLVLTEQSVVGADGLMPVEFRHDAEGSIGQAYFEAIVSFTLESIPGYHTGDCKGFRIIYNSGSNSRAEWVVRSTGE